MKAKYLSEVLDQELLTAENRMIKNIVYDSRKADKYSLFVAISGYAENGHDYLKQAQQNGAVAAIVEKVNKEISLPQYLVQNSRQALARLAAGFYRPEIDQLRLAGVTGTNGKTTTSFLLQSVFTAAGIQSGLIGTIYYHIGHKKIKAWNTTPESVDLSQMLYQMAGQGQKGCVLEASSHGLALHRLDYLQFEIAVFTNLSQDHLDFHENFESYYQAKKILFNLLKKGGRAVINKDDEYGRRLIREIGSDAVTFSMQTDAFVRATDWISRLQGTRVNIMTPQGELHIDSPLIGEFNVENILAATAAGLAMNFDLKTIKAGIEKVARVAGRLEPVPGATDKTIIVDYSHTPDALQKALHILSGLSGGALWVVFGCGGNRDKKKRPMMGKIAEQGADHIIITSDNPRFESPAAIIADVVSGISDTKQIIIEQDRRKAILTAITASNPGDIILVAGKGHEDYQEIEGIKYPFDDREIIREAIA